MPLTPYTSKRPEYLTRSLVRGLAFKWKMPESHVREMLAIGEGYSQGDVVEEPVEPLPWSQRFWRWWWGATYFWS